MANVVAVVLVDSAGVMSDETLVAAGAGTGSTGAVDGAASSLRVASVVVEVAGGESDDATAGAEEPGGETDEGVEGGSEGEAAGVSAAEAVGVSDGEAAGASVGEAAAGDSAGVLAGAGWVGKA